MIGMILKNEEESGWSPFRDEVIREFYIQCSSDTYILLLERIITLVVHFTQTKLYFIHIIFGGRYVGVSFG
jgi:hypothetical protein